MDAPDYYERIQSKFIDGQIRLAKIQLPAYIDYMNANPLSNIADKTLREYLSLPLMMEYIISAKYPPELRMGSKQQMRERYLRMLEQKGRIMDVVTIVQCRRRHRVQLKT